MNITDQPWFKRAAEIAPPPPWMSLILIECDSDDRVVAQSLPGQVMPALYEKHFRKWLEKNAWGAQPHLEVDAQDQPAGYYCWLPCLGVEDSVFGERAKKGVEGETYLECQCVAIAAVEERQLLERATDG